MSNTHYVCFPCRIAVKRPKSWLRGEGERAPRCPHCGNACTELSYKAPIPPKSKNRQWAALFARTLAEQRRRNGYDPAALAAEKHCLEREAAALLARLNDAKNPPHPEHAKHIRRELRRVQNALMWHGVPS